MSNFCASTGADVAQSPLLGGDPPKRDARGDADIVDDVVDLLLAVLGVGRDHHRAVEDVERARRTCRVE